MKNVTLSLPEDLLKLSREYAKKQGTSLNALIRSLLKQEVLPKESHPVISLFGHMDRVSVNTENWKWNRNDVYDREILS